MQGHLLPFVKKSRFRNGFFKVESKSFKTDYQVPTDFFLDVSFVPLPNPSSSSTKPQHLLAFPLPTVPPF